MIKRLDGEPHQRAKADPQVKVLRTLPGVGELTALVMLAEIADISRFPSARKLASWAGLTPTVRGSELTVRHGHISKQGSAWLQWVLNQAAQTAKRSPEFSATYAAITRRRGKHIATTAIAASSSPAPTTCSPRPGHHGHASCQRRTREAMTGPREGHQTPGTVALWHEPGSLAQRNRRRLRTLRGGSNR